VSLYPQLLKFGEESAEMKTIAVFIAFVLILSCPGKADDGFFRGEGATVVPMNNDQVVLLEEEVHMNCILKGYNRHWVVNCKFLFLNSGTKCKIQMGFPDSLEDGPGFGKSAISDFRLFVNGEKVEAKYKTLDGSNADSLFNSNRTKYIGVYTWEVEFKEGETKTLENDYEFYEAGFLGIPYEATWYKGEEEPPGFGLGSTRVVNYVLHTGALWKGKIGKADIHINLGGIYPAHWVFISPSGYTFRDSLVEWQLRDFEPDEDIKVQIVTSASPFFQTATQARKWIEIVNENNYSKKSVELVRNFTYAKYGKSFEEKWLKDFFENYAYWSGAPYKEGYERNVEYSDTLLSDTDREIESLLLELENRLNSF